jgi:hypothetical protein
MNKYNVAPKADRTNADGVVFDSKREMNRWGELQLLQKQGHISDLRRQVQYQLHARGGKVVSTYLADFVYVDQQVMPGETIVEDCKGVRTRMYRLKKKWLLAEHGIRIRET